MKELLLAKHRSSGYDEMKKSWDFMCTKSKEKTWNKVLNCFTEHKKIGY